MPLGIEAIELKGTLRMRAADLETRLLRDGQTLDRVRARLRLIERETTMTITDVALKDDASADRASVVQPNLHPKNDWLSLLRPH